MAEILESATSGAPTPAPDAAAAPDAGAEPPLEFNTTFPVSYTHLTLPTKA